MTDEDNKRVFFNELTKAESKPYMTAQGHLTDEQLKHLGIQQITKAESMNNSKNSVIDAIIPPKDMTFMQAISFARDTGKKVFHPSIGGWIQYNKGVFLTNANKEHEVCPVTDNDVSYWKLLEPLFVPYDESLAEKLQSFAYECLDVEPQIKEDNKNGRFWN